MQRHVFMRRMTNADCTVYMRCIERSREREREREQKKKEMRESRVSCGAERERKEMLRESLYTQNLYARPRACVCVYYIIYTRIRAL